MLPAQVFVNGAITDHLQATGSEDVFTKIEMCRKHYVEVGLGAGFVEQYVR